ncbi:MFS general substrate transporter [Dendrothele bispora CBS 962.96]|uniref:MFS general substrate transporter n=1 Tax=Dendrothele bispora (strain CBS 962.96) TaxID=1314807 RepID=A0A4S8KX01_DENBC|nr:MFS general substrate transporter [Dendrothele bispora CBS 962.96]
MPTRLQYHPNKSFHFGLVLQIVFGFASTFVVANLYYCQPILIPLSLAFNVSYSEVSLVPTLIQAGYATGLLLITPAGDLLRRRQLILLLVIISLGLTIGLAITSSFVTFEALSFLVGTFSVTPQILLPLAADLAPPAKRASALSVVFAGLLLGVLMARVLSGIIAQFTSYRVVYYFAIGVQAFVLLGVYALVPDYPSKNRHLTYGQIMWTMAKYTVTEPVLVQACLINIASSAAFSSFWVTLTFLLGGEPYNYSTLVIGLFGLIGIFGVCMGPVVGKFIDSLIPWYASLIACIALLIFQAVQVIGNGLNIAAVIIATLGLDLFRQMLQTSLATSLFSINPNARARLNAVYILSLFIGQVMGTSVGTKVFLAHGWRACAGVTLAYAGWQIFILLLRGPNCGRFTWIGWEGGWEGRIRKVKATNDVEGQPESGNNNRKESDVDGGNEKTGNENAENGGANQS